MRKYLLFAVLSFCLWGGVKGQASARIQFIHGSADPTQDTMFSWVRDSAVGVNFTRVTNEIAFREANSFNDIFEINAAIVTPTISPIADSLAMVEFAPLDTLKSYSFLFTGVSNPSFFAANPDGRGTANKIIKIDDVREVGGTPGSVDIIFFHGVTDAPTIDIRPQGSPIPLVNDIAYGEYSSYFTVPVGNYTIEMTSADQSSVIRSFQVNLTSLGGQSLILMATGFANPSANQNGAEINLCEVFPDGTVDCIQPILVGIDEILSNVFTVYPNPFQGAFNIGGFDMDGLVSVFNLNGQQVYSTSIQANEEITIDLSFQPSGVYLLKFENSAGVSTLSKLIHKN